MSRTDKDGPHHSLTGIRRYVTNGPTRDFINGVWTAPERQAVRLAAVEIRKEHRANGLVDTEPSARQHRQCAKWLWF